MPKSTFFNLPDEKRDRIIDIALDEFAAHNYDQASISHIVERAGIAKGSLYQYFADKQDLYMYLVQLSKETKQRMLSEVEPPAQNMNVFAYLRWLIRVGVKFEFAHPKLAQIGYRAYFNDSPVREMVLSEAETTSDTYFRDLLQRGIIQGDIDPTLDLDVAVFIFKTVWLKFGNYLLQRLAITPEQLLEERSRVLSNYDIESIFDSLFDVLEQGMGAKPNSVKTKEDNV